jgi:DNA-binding PadR family transcriptional regulator
MSGLRKWFLDIGAALLAPFSGSQMRILAVLAREGAELGGLDIVRCGASRRGHVYVWLAELEDLGWVTSRPMHLARALLEDDGRRVYRITDAGREALRAHDAVRRLQSL